MIPESVQKEADEMCEKVINYVNDLHEKFPELGRILKKRYIALLKTDYPFDGNINELKLNLKIYASSWKKLAIDSRIKQKRIARME